MPMPFLGKKASTLTDKGGGTGTNKSSGGQVALFGQQKLSLGF